jgi:hypothetical protein
MLIGRKFVGGGRKCRDDLVVFTNHESYAFNKVMVDFRAPYILHAGFDRARRQIVGRCYFVIRVGGYGKLSGAIVRVCRKLIQSRDAVGGNANDGGSGGVEFVFLFRERMSLQIAAPGVRRGIEIDDGRPFFQSVLQ